MSASRRDKNELKWDEKLQKYIEVDELGFKVWRDYNWQDDWP